MSFHRIDNQILSTAAPAQSSGGSLPSGGQAGESLILDSSNQPVWGYPKIEYTSRAVSTNATLGSENIINADASSGNLIVTLPSSSAFSGQFYYIFKIDNTSNTIAVVPTDMLDGTTTGITLMYQNDRYQVVSNGSTGWFSI